MACLKVIPSEHTSLLCLVKKCIVNANLRCPSSIKIGLAKEGRKEYVVLGEILKVIINEPENIVFLVKAVLQDCTYGVKFKAIVLGELADKLRSLAPQIGDRLGFFEPFIHANPEYCEPDTGTKSDNDFILEIGGTQKSLMWYAKNGDTMDKNVPASEVEDSSGQMYVESYNQDIASPSSTDYQNLDLPSTSGLSDRQHEPNIQLPVSPKNQRPNNPKSTSRTLWLNPRYPYKDIADIKSIAISGDLERANLFAVVHEVVKPLTETLRGKCTIICKVIDESTDGLIDFYLHFFTLENIIIKQIQQGDILRLHRVKLEIFNGDVDGRIFRSTDIVLFKSTDENVATPIHSQQNLSLTDEEKGRVRSLKSWYKEFLVRQTKDVILLGNITNEGTYSVVCKLVTVPLIKQGTVVLTVTDGSVIKTLVPSKSLGKVANTVTEIGIFGRPDEYARLKAGDIILIRDVVSVKTDGLRLMVNNMMYPQRIDPCSDVVQDMLKRFEEINNKNDEDDVVEEYGPGPSTQTPEIDTSSCKNTNINNKKEHEENLLHNLQSPIVKLTRLPEETYKNKDGMLTVEEEIPESNKRIKKEVNNGSVATIPYEDYANDMMGRRLEFESTHLDSCQSTAGMGELEEEETQKRSVSSDELKEQFIPPETKQPDDISIQLLKELLVAEKFEPPLPDLSHCLVSLNKKLRVFLVCVLPDISKGSLDLVSGYCHSGCNGLYLFSLIHWSFDHETKEKIPYCPECIISNRKMALELMLFFEVRVMDLDGDHITLVASREHAEIFLGCTTYDFVKDGNLRRSRTQLLYDYTVNSTMPKTSTPVMDISVMVHDKVLLIVNTKLVLPNEL